jgi:Glucodextranase, domain B
VRRYGEMTTRRGSHVRPRPPSSGRTRPVKVAAPDRRRVRQHRGIDARRKRAPLAARTLLALAVVALAAGAYVAASGGVGPVLSTLGAGIGSAYGRLTATPLPSATDLLVTDSPRVVPPTEPYTNVALIDLTVSVPTEVVGDPGAKVRIYLALEGLAPAPIVDVPVGAASRMTIPFELTAGRNDISATLFRGSEESDQSPIVTYYLDQEPPKITVTSPKNGAAVNAFDITIKGTTQAGTSLVSLNSGNGTSIASVAAADGTFDFGMGLAAGTNEITITGTDPAGNVGTTTLKILQGSKDISIRLSASNYTFSVKHPPTSIQLSVVVTDPSGAPLAGASAFFVLQIPGLSPISNTIVTNTDGRAVFTTPLVGTFTTGGGLGTVSVSSDLYGTSSDRVTLTFGK